MSAAPLNPVFHWGSVLSEDMDVLANFPGKLEESICGFDGGPVYTVRYGGEFLGLCVKSNGEDGGNVDENCRICSARTMAAQMLEDVSRILLNNKNF